MKRRFLGEDLARNLIQSKWVKPVQATSAPKSTNSLQSQCKRLLLPKAPIKCRPENNQAKQTQLVISRLLTNDLKCAEILEYSDGFEMKSSYIIRYLRISFALFFLSRHKI